MNIDTENEDIPISLTLSFISTCMAKQIAILFTRHLMNTLPSLEARHMGLVVGKRAVKLEQRKKCMSAAAAARCTMESRR